MNPWGFLVMAAGFVMLYIGVKGNASAVVNAFRPQGSGTAAQGAPSTTPPPNTIQPGGLYPQGNTTPPPGGSVYLGSPGATGLVTQ